MASTNSLDGKQRLIGYYDDEEEAAVDYARAVFLYKGGAKRVGIQLRI